MITSPSTRSIYDDMALEAKPSLLDPVDVELADDSDTSITVIINEDGSSTLAVELPDDELPFDALPHDYNFARRLTSDVASTLASDLIALVEGDLSGRSEWECLQEKGLELLSLKVEDKNTPWPGASAAKHPILMDAMIRYQSDTIREIFPVTGPANTFIFAKQTPETLALASRVKTELNYQTTCVMKSYKASLEQTLLSGAYGGVAYRKMGWNDLRREPEAKFVPGTDLILQHGSANLHESTRFTHRQSLNDTEWAFMCAGCDWIDEPEPSASPKSTSTDTMKEEVSGVSKNYLDTSVEVYEIYTFLDHEDLFGGEVPDVPAPFIIVLDTQSSTVRCIRRNWREDDETRKPLAWFSEYAYIPSPWGLPLGLIHIIGGLTDAGTALLRQMIDAGTLSNVPSGFKNRSLKISNSEQPIEPGEFRDVETYDGSKVKDLIEFMPSRPVDATSFQLLQAITEEGRKVASAADIKASDASAAATGAMMAVLERATSVMSAVQARAADAIAMELDILRRIIADYAEGSYVYEVEGGPFDRQEDFRAAVGIKSVADPSASTQAMRILRNQAITAQASQNPDLYDQTELHRRVMRDLGVNDVESLIPRAGDAPMRDPVSENQALLMGQSIKAYMEQDHQAHIAVHTEAMQNPGLQAFVGQSQNGPKIIAAAQAHMAEHMAFQYRHEIEKGLGFALPPPGEPLPADIEAQLSRAVAQVKIPSLGQPAQAQEQAPDPIVMLQQQELKIKEAELALKQATLELQAEKIKQGVQNDMRRADVSLAQDETRREAAQLNAQVEVMRIQTESADNKADRDMQLGVSAEKILQTDRIEGTKAGIQAAAVQNAAKALEERAVKLPVGAKEEPSK